MKQKDLLNDISRYIALFKIEIEIKNKHNEYDINLHAENVIIPLLNIVLDCNLINLNAKKKNRPALDLGDKDKSIAVQVTSETSIQKIRDTFSVLSDDDSFQEVYIFILGKKLAYSNKSMESVNGLSIQEFKHYVIDFGDLYNKIVFLDIEKMNLITGILKTQFQDTGLDIIVEFMEKAHQAGNCNSVLEIYEEIKDKLELSNIPPEIRLKVYLNIAQAYEALGLNAETSLFYKKASQNIFTEPEKSYFQGLSLLNNAKKKEALKAKSIAKQIINKYSNNKRGYQLALLSGAFDNLKKFTDSIPADIKKDPKILYLLSHAYSKENDLGDAMIFIKQAIESEKEALQAKTLKVALVEYKLLRILRGVVIQSKLIPSLHIREKLEKYYGQLTEYWSEIENKDIAKMSTAVLRWRAKLEFLLEKNQHTSTIDMAIALGGKNPQDLYCKAEFLIAEKRYGEAIEILADIESDAIILFIFVIEIESKRNLSLESLDKLFLELSNKLKEGELLKEAVGLYLRRVKSIDLYSFEIKLQEYKAQLSKEDLALFRFLSSKDKKRIRYLGNFIKNMNTSSDRAVLGLWAEECINLGIHKEAIEILRNLVNPNFFTSVDSEIVRLSGFTCNDLEYLELINEYISQFGNLHHLVAAKLKLSEAIGDIKEQAKDLEVLFKDKPNDLRLLIQKAFLAIKMGDDVDTEKIVSLYNKENWPVEYGLNIASLLWHSDKFEDAIDFSYELVNNFPRVSEANKLFLGFMTFYSMDGPNKWIDTVVVQNGSVVRIQNEDGDIGKYVIEEDKPNEKLRQYEINNQAGLYTQLINGRMNEKLEGVGKIISIKHKYIDKYSEILSEVNELVPDGSIRKIKMQSADPSDFITSFKQELGKIDQSKKYELEFFSNHLLPIGVLAQRVYGNFIDAWGNLTQNPKIGIKCADGTREESMEARFILKNLDQDSACVLDYSMLLTLDMLDLKSQFAELFPSILIAPSLIFDIKQLIKNHEMLHKGETMQVGLDQGEIRSRIYDEEFNQVRLDKLKGLMLWLNEACTTIPAKKILEVGQDKREKFAEMFGAHTFESIYLAAEKNLTLISCDLVMRVLANKEHGVSSLWIQPILHRMLDKRIIDIEKYENHINTLVFNNYKYISITASNIQRHIKESSYGITRNLDQFLLLLKDSSANSVTIMLVELITWIYQQPLLDLRKTSFMVKFLETVYSRSDAQFLLKEIHRGIEKKLYLQPFLFHEINLVVRKWWETKS